MDGERSMHPQAGGGTRPEDRIRLVVGIDPAGEPLSGTIADGSKERHFAGLLELISQIEAARARHAAGGEGNA